VEYTVALIEGDGIGPEQTAATKTVLAKLKETHGLALNLIEVKAGDRALKDTGEALSQENFNIIKKCDCCLKGPVGQSAYDVIIRLRTQLDLFANIRPAKHLPRVPCIASPETDFVIVRENTEDLYVGLESANEEKATATRIITRKASERIAKYAFELAKTRKKVVTAVHKSNVLKKTDGLFLHACRDVSKTYPDVQFYEMFVDTAAMNLIRSPQIFDIIVTTNMFGDILSDEAAQVVGGLGLAPSANVGDHFALFEPVHGAAPDIAGKNIANPISLVLSAAMMLEWLGKTKNDTGTSEASRVIQRAVEQCLRSGEVTPDLGGQLNTAQMGDAIAAGISK